jgi:hypothetical protein
MNYWIYYACLGKTTAHTLQHRTRLLEFDDEGQIWRVSPFLATSDEIRTWLKTVDLTELDFETTQVESQGS